MVYLLNSPIDRWHVVVPWHYSAMALVTRLESLIDSPVATFVCELNNVDNVVLTGWNGKMTQVDMCEPYFVLATAT